MVDQKKFHECLQRNGVFFFTGVPDSLLNDFCLYLESELPRERNVIAANEGNAVSIAVGFHLTTGSVPLVYMQNSGIGNATNPLLSLTNKEVYSIPMILLIGWRGEPGVSDWAQHQKQGELTPVLLDAMDIPYKVIDDNLEEAIESATWAVSTAKRLNSPVALLARKRVFEKGEKEVNYEDNIYKLSREEAMKCVIECVPKDAIFVATTGRAARELYELRNLSGNEHDMDFLNVGAMGHASSIATGIALAENKRLVVCLDGDAAAIMHLGALTTSGMLGLPNLMHVVLNNGANESVGGQPSAGFKANLTGVAESAGYKTVGSSIATKESLRDSIKKLLSIDGPAFIDVRIRKGIRSDLPPLRITHSKLKKILMKNIKELR